MSESDFFEKLASLCACNKDRAEVLEGLATLLGRAACIMAEGEPKVIETLLTGAENHAAQEAASFQELVQMARSAREE